MSENKAIDEWKVTTKRFVAFIDIMGFKDMVARKSHNEIYKMMIKIDDRKALNENIKWGDREEKLVSSTTYSDSIMIYSKDNSLESLRSFVCTVSGLSDDLLLEGIPHKGAFAFGTMTLDKDKSIYFGQPLIDAYLLQEEIYFYGIIGHASAELEISNIADGEHVSFLKNYPCPLKGSISNHLVIYPMDANILKPGDKEDSEKLMKAVRDLRYNTSGHLRKYIDNTENFLSIIGNKKKNII
ncbi:MAG: hypothetical protein REI78_05880 [Pedobacter sp.]|nr:hypothetical protein [Pedobacter sp.]MDQ8052532.1 hypothetical protein [Pedobacter sp.]